MKTSRLSPEWTTVGFDCGIRHLQRQASPGQGETTGPVLLRSNKQDGDSPGLQVFCEGPAALCGASAGS